MEIKSSEFVADSGQFLLVKNTVAYAKRLKEGHKSNQLVKWKPRVKSLNVETSGYNVFFVNNFIATAWLMFLQWRMIKAITDTV